MAAALSQLPECKFFSPRKFGGGACSIGIQGGKPSIGYCLYCISKAHNNEEHADVEKAKVRPSGGVGTELKKLLSQAGFKPSKKCRCEAHARLMDQMGPKWCEISIPLIVSWMKEDSGLSGFPFVETAATLLLKSAIRTANNALTLRVKTDKENLTK